MKKIFSEKTTPNFPTQQTKNFIFKRHASHEFRPSIVLLRFISASIICSGLGLGFSSRKIEKQENEPYPKIKSQK